MRLRRPHGAAAAVTAAAGAAVLAAALLLSPEGSSDAVLVVAPSPSASPDGVGTQTRTPRAAVPTTPTATRPAPVRAAPTSSAPTARPTRPAPTPPTVPVSRQRTSTAAPAPRTSAPRPRPTQTAPAPARMTTPPPPPPTRAPASAGSAYTSRLLALVNAARAERGLGRLATSSCAQGYAQRQAAAMARRGTMYHQDLGPVLSACDARSAGENVAYGSISADQMFRNWMASPSHRANVLGRSWTHLGNGATTRSDGRVYGAQVFVDLT